MLLAQLVCLLKAGSCWNQDYRLSSYVLTESSAAAIQLWPQPREQGIRMCACSCCLWACMCDCESGQLCLTCFHTSLDSISVTTYSSSSLSVRIINELLTISHVTCEVLIKSSKCVSPGRRLCLDVVGHTHDFHDIRLSSQPCVHYPQGTFISDRNNTGLYNEKDHVLFLSDHDCSL